MAHVRVMEVLVLRLVSEYILDLTTPEIFLNQLV